MMNRIGAYVGSCFCFLLLSAPAFAESSELNKQETALTFLQTVIEAKESGSSCSCTVTKKDGNGYICNWNYSCTNNQSGSMSAACNKAKAKAAIEGAICD